MCKTSGLNLTSVSPELPLRDEIRTAYDHEPTYSSILKHLRSPSEDTLRVLSRSKPTRINRYRLDDDLLTYSIDNFDAPRIVVSSDSNLRSRIIQEFHDAPLSDHVGHEKTFTAVSRDFFWPHFYKWARKWPMSFADVVLIKTSWVHIRCVKEQQRIVHLDRLRVHLRCLFTFEQGGHWVECNTLISDMRQPGTCMSDEQCLDSR
ncbi:hypothetical protein F441_12832 [Phytophthora nicotianae CJ01A1]|uniref:Integrase zinc-binding domain-containing protein n=2 Tax=Phytophthora nicotianae TaxID=4792 RepID=W2WMU5_PHYNI|nr:hypothetical protein L917_12323 [Phytophthora nicotianae]ETP11672.1 hypothetical protein F441_12832 [Phytophthora nicotianae CJ01A1]